MNLNLEYEDNHLFFGRYNQSVHPPDSVNFNRSSRQAGANARTNQKKIGFTIF